MSEFISFLKEQQTPSNMVVIFCIVIFSGAFALSAYTTDKVQEIISTNRVNNLEDITNLQKNHIHTLLKVRHEQIEMLSVARDVLEYQTDPQQTQTFLSNIVENTKNLHDYQYEFITGKSEIHDISIIDQTGTFILSTNKDKIQTKLSEEKTTALFAHEYVFDGISKDDETPLAVFSHKIENNQDQEALVLIRTQASFIDSIANNIQSLGESGRMYIIDKNNTIINTVKDQYDENIEAMTEIAQSSQIRSCFDGDTSANHYINHNNTKVLGISTYLADEEWCVLTEINESELDKDTSTLKATFMPVENHYSPLSGHSTWD
jgi:hypothetical protein